MADFTTRDKTIATVLCWGLLLAFASVIIFMDGFRSVEHLYNDVGRFTRSNGIWSFEVEWFACLVVSLAILLWGNRVRAMLLHCSPPWLALMSHWTFCIFCGVLGVGFYMFNMFLIMDMEEWVLPLLQGGILSMGFALLCIGGMTRPLPKK